MRYVSLFFLASVLVGCAGSFDKTKAEIQQATQKGANEVAEVIEKAPTILETVVDVIEAVSSDVLDAGKDLYCLFQDCDETPPAP